MLQKFLCLCFLSLMLNWLPSSLSAQQESWEFERVWLRDGRQIQGLLLNSPTETYEFAEIVRPRGKPAYGIVRTIPTSSVLKYAPLEAGSRALLRERFDSIRHRSLIEARRQEELTLRTVELEGTAYLLYDGPWFTIYSTADESLTRKSIVRIEQTFCAFRQLLPPRLLQPSAFVIYFYGSTREYKQAQQRGGWKIEHPAFYDADKNVILAGTDMRAYAFEIARASAENAKVQQQLKQLTERLENSLAEVATEMKRNGFASSDVEDEIRRRRAQWNEQARQLEKQISEATQKNAKLFEELTGDMFRRLHHEAFHAYLQNYVFTPDKYDVPRWLKEGLAQVFEHAQLDADTLRIDAPDSQRLKRLQADLRGKTPLHLAELWIDSTRLLAGHEGQIGTERHYLYAWGFAYYMAFQTEKLNGNTLEQFVVKNEVAPEIKLEKLWGKELTAIEQQWRQDMLRLKE